MLQKFFLLGAMLVLAAASQPARAEVAFGIGKTFVEGGSAVQKTFSVEGDLLDRQVTLGGTYYDGDSFRGVDIVSNHSVYAQFNLLLGRYDKLRVSLGAEVFDTRPELFETNAIEDEDHTWIPRLAVRKQFGRERAGGGYIELNMRGDLIDRTSTLYELRFGAGIGRDR